MIWYHFVSGIYILWVPLIILYTILAAMVPGMILIAILLPLSYAFFKRAESYFADVI